MGCSNSLCMEYDKLKKIDIPSPNKKKGTFFHTTKHKSFLFDFGTKKIEQINKLSTIEFSNCTLEGLQKTYEELVSPISRMTNINDYYVVCPVYINKKTKLIRDTQLAVTGNCKTNEDELNGVIREIQEELGITCNKSNAVLITSNCTGRKLEQSFIINASNARYFDPKIDSSNENENRGDDKSKKIQVVVCGKLTNLLNIYKNVINRPESNDIETIKFVRFVSILEFV